MTPLVRAIFSNKFRSSTVFFFAASHFGVSSRSLSQEIHINWSLPISSQRLGYSNLFKRWLRLISKFYFASKVRLFSALSPVKKNCSVINIYSHYTPPIVRNEKDSDGKIEPKKPSPISQPEGHCRNYHETNSETNTKHKVHERTSLRFHNFRSCKLEWQNFGFFSLDFTACHRLPRNIAAA